MPLERRFPITVIEVLIVVVIVILLAMAGWLAHQGPSAIRITSVPEEVSLVSFTVTLADSKGRTIPATITVCPADLSKLAQGNIWRVLVNTDDVQWNLEE